MFFDEDGLLREGEIVAIAEGEFALAGAFIMR